MNDDQLERARQVHYAFLPEGHADEDVEVCVTVMPHGDLGGDYCGIVPLAEGKVALTVCDATGHDVAAALFAARVNTHVLSHLMRMQKPCELVESLNEFLARRMGSANMHATFCAAVLDPRSGYWDFAGAGHPPAIHFRAKTAEATLVKSQTVMVGIYDSLPIPASTTRSDVAVGDRILLFTDGLTEARNAAGEMFGLERMCAWVVQHADLKGAAFGDALFAAVGAHAAGAFEDDALLVTATLL